MTTRKNKKGAIRVMAVTGMVCILSACGTPEAIPPTPTETARPSAVPPTGTPSATRTPRPPTSTPTEIPADYPEPPAVQLTSNNISSWLLSWSRDGKQIAYASSLDTLTIVNSDGTNDHRVGASVPVWQMDWSPDGSHLAYDRKLGDELFIAHSNYPAEETPVEGPPLEKPKNWYAWSPDGKLLAWVASVGGRSELWVTDSSGKESRFVSAIGAPYRWARWIDDTAWIVYLEGEGYLKPIRIGLDGSRQTLPWVPMPSKARYAVLSPDRTKVVYVTAAENWEPGQLWLLTVDDGEVRALPPQTAWRPIWSPDGKRIAFGCPRDDGQISIQVINADGTGLMTVSSQSHLSAPRYQWSPDGRRLAFNSDTHGMIGHTPVLVIQIFVVEVPRA